MSFTRTIALLAALFAGCATAPSTRAEKQSLQTSARATLDEMIAQNPAIQDTIHNVPGYAVFPSIGKGGVLVGGAHGRGILYENGVPTGYVAVEQASIGAQLGGQTFAELIVFRDQFAVEKLKAGQFEIGANASAMALTAGASGAASFTDGIAVFTVPQGGLMAELSVSGQKLDFQPRG